MLTTAQTCPAKYALRKEGWTTRRRSGALGFGAALHEGLAAWYKTADLGQALLAIRDAWPEFTPADDFRTMEKCLQTMMEYVRKYPAETFDVVGKAEGNPVIENSFTLDTGMKMNCPCGFSPGPCVHLSDDKKSYVVDAPENCPKCGLLLEPLEYGGILDGLVEWAGNLYILEHKSTSMMGGSYFNQFKPNNQVTGYIWGAGRLSGQRVSGAIVNAIGIYKASATKFEREITTRSLGEIVEWMHNLWHECQTIRHHETTGFWPMRTQACTLYGLCEYHSIHVLNNETERRKLLEQDYIKELWDHEGRDG